MSTAYRFSVAQYEQMFVSGLFMGREDIRTELIFGEVRQVNPPNPPHEDTVDKLNYWSMEVAPREQIRVRIQQSLGIPELDSVPEPDVAWVRVRDDYRSRRPTSADVLLLIEVSETSLEKDRTEKARLYAEANVPDYWIVNLIEGCIEVFRDPVDGHYSTQFTRKHDQQLGPLCLPAAKLRVADLF